MQATYEYERPNNRNMLYVSMGGVALNFDLNTQEAGPITDADEAQVNAWLVSEDGRLVQDTSVAIIEQGNPEANWELLLNYYAVAMLVDNDPPAESALKVKSKVRNLAHHARVGSTSALSKTQEVTFVKSCLKPSDLFAPSTTLTRYSNLLQPTLATPQGGCFGCCGIRCACMPIFGGPMYTSACGNHDRCTRNAGGRFARGCTWAFIGAVFSVWGEYRRSYMK